ncbi:MAG TPA: spore germination protein [Oscillospiraceae bacterium]|nr:spore germination protein [Oscillospiraceae bacterium]HPF55113.1 spore germination protein [Clostridiales bacterium]HPK34569.1 spore germination protein [Oscillospiraceae bacterium]HPR76748.1 spore germination protein [Oscillospiraceae bacterium]
MADSFDVGITAAALRSNHSDFTERSIPFHNGIVKLFYINQLTDRAAVTENVIKPLMLYGSLNKKSINAHMAVDDIIFADDCKIESDIDKIEEFILSGMVVILFSTGTDYIVANFKKVEHRSVATPNLNYTLRGPQDCFTENLDVNISLLRYRLKDKNTKIEKYKVGVRTKTQVAVVYIEDIANDTVVTEIQKRIQAIDIDGIGESGELQAFLLNKKTELFPNVGLVERSDMALHSLLEGKVLVLVEGSGLALLAPKTFVEFFYSCDDRYDNKFFGFFARMLRYISFMIAFTASSIFVAITSFHTDVLPSTYIIALAEMRVKVPFNALIAAFLIEFIVELIRESLLRVPKQIGSAIGIVGAIVIGQAAISAGIFSPVLLIIGAIALLASFSIPDYTLVKPIRILKFILLLFTGTLGFFGFSLFLTWVLAELVSLNSFGVPYMAPLAPFNLYDFIRVLFKNVTMDPKRPHYLRTKDQTRTKQ